MKVKGKKILALLFTFLMFTTLLITPTFAWSWPKFNIPPAAVPDLVFVIEDTQTSIPVLSNDFDLDGDSFSIVSVSTPQHGTTVLSGDNVIYTPNLNYNGSNALGFNDDSFTYTISDGKDQMTATVSIDIVAINDPPTAGNDSFTINENSGPFTFTKADLLANDSDIETPNNSLDFDVGSISATRGTLVRSGDQFTYTPNLNEYGSDTLFTYTITDKGEYYHDYGKKSATATVIININFVNTAPAANGATLTTTEDTACTLDVTSLISDADSDPLTCSVASAANGTTSISGNVITYDPNDNFNGNDSFTYTANDGKGGTATATISVTVTAENDAPVAVNDTVKTNEDTALTIASTDLLINDTDVDGDTLQITGVTSPSAQGGFVSLSSDQSEIIYTPFLNFNGTDTFTYTVSDGTATADATVTVEVGSINDNPIAQGDSATIYKNGLASILPLFNDSDLEDNFSELVITGIGTPQHGTISYSDSWLIEYTPDTDYTGTDSFDYTVADSDGGTATATITITIQNPSLAVTKTADDNSVNVGDTVKYTITITNNGDIDCGKVEFYDSLLDQTIDCGTLAAGDTYTYEYPIYMDHAGNVSNKVDVTGYYGVFEGPQTYVLSESEGEEYPGYEYDYRATASAEELVTVSEKPTPPQPPVTYYNLTVGIEGSGTVLPGVGTYALSSGSVQVLQVKPADGYKFDGWTGANGSQVTSSGSNYSIIVNGNKSITAKFVVLPPENIQNDETPQSGDVVQNTSDQSNDNQSSQETVITDKPVPLDEPILPKTAGIPVELLMSAGFILSAGGVMLRKPRKYKNDKK